METRAQVGRTEKDEEEVEEDEEDEEVVEEEEEEGWEMVGAPIGVWSPCPAGSRLTQAFR